MKKLLAMVLAFTLLFTLCAVGVGAATDKSGVPTGSGVNFFANGTPITIGATQPSGTLTVPGGFTATGTDAYISWSEGTDQKYVGVDATAWVFGGADGTNEAVRVPSTSITMTGGTIFRIYAGNLGADASVSGQTLAEASAVTGNASIVVSGGVVTDYIAAGRWNSAINGTVTIDVSNMVANACYISGGIHGNGKEGYIDTASKTIHSNAVVNQAIVTVKDSEVMLVSGGGGGHTVVNAVTITVGDGIGNGDTIVGDLFPAGINGTTKSSSLTIKSDAKITTLASTNRGYLGTATVTVEGGTIDTLYTGAVDGCFTSDGSNASAVTGSVVFDIQNAAGIANAVVTPNINKSADGSYEANVNNVTVNNKDTANALELAVDDFSTGHGTTVNQLTVSEGSSLQMLGNTDLTIGTDNSIVNSGTIVSEGQVTNNGLVSNTATGVVQGVDADGVRVITQGANESRTVKATTDLVIVSSGSLDEWSGGGTVSVNGVNLDLGTDFTASEGSVKVTLLKSYLDQLAVGTYTYRVTYLDGSYAETQFRIVAAAGRPNPSTGVSF